MDKNLPEIHGGVDDMGDREGEHIGEESETLTFKSNRLSSHII